MRGVLAGPKRPSDFLGAILRDARTLAARAEVSEALASVLGPDLAPHCRIAGMSAGRLIVEVDSAPLRAELHGFRREAIRDGMNALLPKRKVAEIVFRMGVPRDE